MSKASRKAVASTQPHGYQFGGPLGTLAMTVGLPFVCYLAAFLCNDVSGCPAPSVLHPSQLSWESLKKDIGWPEQGIWGLCSLKVFGCVVGYYLLSAILQTVLPGEVVQGTPLRSGSKLEYKINAFNTAAVILVASLAGTVVQGPDFFLWTFIWDNYVAIMTANLGISMFLASFVYYRSFSVKAGNVENRELAAGGHSGNMLYDWFIGRELNPRVDIPLLGTFDIKSFCELRPGMIGWVVLDSAFVAHQYKSYGYITDSIVLVTLFQSVYVLDALWMEPAVLTTIDITTDGFGFMLAFGDLVWLPFIYSWQARYLAVYPLQLGVLGTLGVLSVQGLGYYIFRSANNEKNRFRKNPNDERVSHLKYMTTKSGSKLLVSGSWGRARHINYLGDWVYSWAFCLPTGIAGYVVQRTSPASVLGSQFPANGNGAFVGGVAEGKEVVQGEARGWGMIVTYFFILYFTVLLIHRETRDEEKCVKKYGKDWEAYKKRVPYKFVPGVY
ncbi:MAG: erg24, C-14 sterol reductase [Sclerophora amabilis]|nr:MAG: erg24, C-14 sterol reductase [Sclerophora amabilis]